MLVLGARISQHPRGHKAPRGTSQGVPVTRRNITGPDSSQTALVLTWISYKVLFLAVFSPPLIHSNCWFGEYFAVVTAQPKQKLLLLSSQWLCCYCCCRHYLISSFNPLQFISSAKHTHNSNFTSKPFQQGYQGWLRTKSSSYAKCTSQKVTMQPIKHIKHNIHWFTLLLYISVWSGLK